MSDRHPLSERFHDVLIEVGAMHDAKQADYGSQYDPFANIRESEKLGVPSWGGAALRMNDKMVRIQKAVRDTLDTGKPNLRNEGVKDSFLDMAVYAIIGLVCYEDWEDQQMGLGGLDSIDLDSVAEALGGTFMIVGMYAPEDEELTEDDLVVSEFTQPDPPTYSTPDLPEVTLDD